MVVTEVVEYEVTHEEIGHQRITSIYRRETKRPPIVTILNTPSPWGKALQYIEVLPILWYLVLPQVSGDRATHREYTGWHPKGEARHPAVPPRAGGGVPGGGARRRGWLSFNWPIDHTGHHY